MNRFVVAIFSDEAQADEGIRVFEELHSTGVLTLYGLRVLRKEPGGEVKTVEKVGKGLPGAGVGALAGGLVGLLGGPLTAALGAAGGAWIGTWRDIAHLGVGAEFLEDVSRELAPGTIAVVADVTEDRVSPLDERLEALGAVVLREWQAEFAEARLVTEAAARKAELDHLKEERAELPEARREVFELRIEKAERKLDEIAHRAETQLAALEESSDEKLSTLEQQAEAAGASSKASIERRIAEIRSDRSRREALLKQTLEIASAAQA